MPSNKVQGTHLAQRENHKQKPHDADLDPGPDVANLTPALDGALARERLLTRAHGGRVAARAEPDEGDSDEERDRDEQAVYARTTGRRR